MTELSQAKIASARQKIDTPNGTAWAYNLLGLRKQGYDVDALPYSVRVLLENALRHSGRVAGAAEAARLILDWPHTQGGELPLMPFRVLLQDYTGVPLVVDLAAMRDAAKAARMDPRLVNSKVPVDLIIDHSIQVDAWSSTAAFDTNLEREYERNSERYALLKWAQSAFKGIRVFPPGKGICHQVNLEYLSSVVATGVQDGELHAFPDSLLGTDSHTTMVNGLGVLGWGVGGIEAEAVMLGEPYHMPIPKVLGVKFTGALREGVTPTDMVLTVTEKLRERNLVGMFVEYFGEGYRQLSVPDRATLGNMSPEYGATVGFCPVDEATIAYLRGTGRDAARVDFVKRYAAGMGFFLSDLEPKYSEVLAIELDKIEPSIAGPRNPEERHALTTVPSFARVLLEQQRRSSPIQHQTTPATNQSAGAQLLIQQNRQVAIGLGDGAVVIAAITSCTNTSNPTVMVGAGLLARRAVEKGLLAKPWVKRSLAPGSTVVTDYLRNSGLLRYLDELGFNLVGYGCTTCIGNSGPLAPEVEREIKSGDLYAVAVLSGNRNFDGRIHPLVKGSFLMSPMLVVAYALAGRIGFDFSTPLGTGKDGRPVYLKDLWPSLKDIKATVERSLSPGLYKERYADAMKGDDRWESLAAYADDTYHWEEGSTYIRQPPWFEPSQTRSAKTDIKGARILAVLEDKVTTDHISPAGTIAVDSPAGKYLTERGVDFVHFSSYGSRRGNHEVMTRGGFSNIRLRNALAPGRDGGWTTYLPTKKLTTIFEASAEYIAKGIPLVVVAGKQYGAGSSRDWAAKAPKLLGVRAVLAENFERIHRSNLVAMGVLPLQFRDGENRGSLGLKGDETLDILGISKMKGPKELVEVVARGDSGERKFKVICRVDNATEMQYLEKGGVLPYVFARLHSFVH
ncbi:MAG: aconitate hydratase AcnA [Nitrososphaerales archaeon]|nr:aconitate hydratase AcnA [Nitrososphaerales archaeon]